MSRCHLGRVMAVAALALLAGCGRPTAPKLNQKEAVYHSAAEGFGFAAPPGWQQFGRSEFPPARHERPRLLVKYIRVTSSHPAIFRVELIDLAPSRPVVDFLKDRTGGPENWQPQARLEDLTVDGQPAVRVTYNGSWEAEVLIKEVVAVQRGERFYLFTGIYPPNDAEARKQVRAALGTVYWAAEPRVSP